MNSRSFVIAFSIFFALTAANCSRAATARSKDNRLELELPDKWEQTEPKTAVGKISAHNLDKHAYVTIISEPREDFDGLQSYADLVLKQEAEHSKVADRKVTGPEKLTIGGEPALRYTVTGELNGMKLIYLKTFLGTASRFNQVMCWTTPSHLAEAQDDLHFLPEHLKELPATTQK